MRQSAVGKLQVDNPAASGVAGALMGLLAPLAKEAEALGLDKQAMDLLKSHGVDGALRAKVIAGLGRYLESNGDHLMEVALKALVGKLAPAT